VDIKYCTHPEKKHLGKAGYMPWNGRYLEYCVLCGKEMLKVQSLEEIKRQMEHDQRMRDGGF
jgi:hypothetical protein